MSGIMDKIGKFIDGAKDKTEDTVEAAKIKAEVLKDKAEDVLEDAKTKAETLKDKVEDIFDKEEKKEEAETSAEPKEK
ncbi:MAG TPA: hypothetical protein DIT32_02380 [Peptococcaceae bacterium]|nr:hypothetical protein [Peptococcaceae bacterium]